MKIELSHKRSIKKTKNLFKRYYATGENNEPDYLVHTTNEVFVFGLKRTKDEIGEFDKDIRISYEDLPQPVKEFIKKN